MDDPRDPVAPVPGPPGPPTRGEQVLVGTVTAEAGCVLLLVGGRRWALTGAATDLEVGTKVEVRGTVGGAPYGCPALATLRVTTVRRL